jgi:hypothetical protein
LFRCYGNGSRAFLLSIYLAVTSRPLFRGRVYAVTSPFPSPPPHVPAKPKTLSRQNCHIMKSDHVGIWCWFFMCCWLQRINSFCLYKLHSCYARSLHLCVNYQDKNCVFSSQHLFSGQSNGEIAERKERSFKSSINFWYQSCSSCHRAD